MKYRRKIVQRRSKHKPAALALLGFLERVILAAIEMLQRATIKLPNAQARGVAAVLISLALDINGGLLVALVRGDRIQATELGD